MLHAIRKVLRPLKRNVIAKASRGYISGEQLDDAIKTISILNSRGFSTTVGYWNEPGEDPGTVLKRNLAAIDAISQLDTDCYLSMKAPAVGVEAERYDPIVRKCNEKGLRLHFDSLGPEFAGTTFDLIEKLSLASPVGCTIPGRWRRSLSDAERAIALRIPVRVVKGQWVDPEGGDCDVNEGYLAVVRKVAGRVPHVRIATHDPVVAENAVKTLLAAKTSCELEMLYGLPVRRILAVASQHRLSVRMYVPYGSAFLPYALANMGKDPRALWWLIRDYVSGSYLSSVPHYQTGPAK
jgi:proline dehydrogenase